MSERRERETLTFTKPFKCDVQGCNKSYPAQQALNQHFKRIHADKHTIMCPECSKMCHSKQALAYHRRCYHKDKSEKYYKCVYCGCSKYYAYNFDLCKHIRTCHDPSYKKNAKERRFLCTVEGCGKSFFRADNLRQHHENAHMDKPCCITYEGYHCWSSGCNVVCKRWVDLLKHRRLEHPEVYVCENCGDVFYRKRQLTIHVQLHINPHMKLHYCTYKNCKKVYATECGKKYHIETVHRRYHVCPHYDCGEKFISKITLRQHMKQHVKKEPSSDDAWENDRVGEAKYIEEKDNSFLNMNKTDEVNDTQCILKLTSHESYKMEAEDEDKENNSLFKSSENSCYRNISEKTSSGFETFFNQRKASNNFGKEVENTNTDILHELCNFLSHDIEADVEVMENILQQNVFIGSENFILEDSNFSLYEENIINDLPSVSELVKPNIRIVNEPTQNGAIDKCNTECCERLSVTHSAHDINKENKSEASVRNMSIEGKVTRKLDKLLMIARRYYNTVFVEHETD